MSFTAVDWGQLKPAPPETAPGSGSPQVGDMHIDDLLMEATERKASDLHLTERLPPVIRLDGKLVRLNYQPLTGQDVQRLIYEVLTNQQIQWFEKVRELDFSYGIAGVGRFRFNVYRQRGSIGAAMRAIPTKVPSLEELKLPTILRDLTRRPSGLILITGATGAGKSTTLASMIDIVNGE
ncbi:MAG TPA: ATPase, T2SS/T4P/T4SS family, partial [Armatimonadota bacterium]|nr:ATPase, T2SS/T4P/T4SS family [Armatimonadota bacterium]